METLIARSIFTPATGFILRGGFAWTCNPYLGCTFGCQYCYAMFLPQNRRPLADWGRWLVAKSNAIDLARQTAHKLRDQALYLSSVTDPYLPVERRLRLTRGILEALVPVQPRLLVQTRGPLVVRDLDLLRCFHQVRVNISIPTDDEDVRRAFEPKAPPLAARWQAAAAVRAAGVAVGICVTPMLPVVEPGAFIERLLAFRPDVLVVQDFHDRRGAFGANTAPAARASALARGWTSADYLAIRDALARRYMTYEGEAGFFPPGGSPAVASALSARIG
jgi:DNA repair photolyase